MFAPGNERGFSLLDTLIAIMILGVVSVAVIPQTYLTAADIKLRGDAQAISQMIGLAKMRAAAQFTRERLYVDLSGRRFKLQHWDKTGAAWVDDTAYSELSSGISFSYGSVTAPPSNTQDALSQSPLCTNNSNNTISG